MSEQPTAPPANSADSYDRNLVVAVLAYQNHFIESPALRTALETCAQKSDRSVADWLLEKQHLTRPRRELIEALAAEHLKQHQNDPRRSLAALSAADRNRRILEEMTGSAALQSTGPLHAAALDGTVSLATPPVTAKTSSSAAMRSARLQPSSQRFRIVRPHAEGGLGKVSVARDEELNREVALKEIKPQFAHQVSARNRFLLEAEITGGLEHPGIVPVYSLGADEHGHPYYAMRFIQGDSLKDAIQSFFRKYGSQPSADSKLPAAAYQSLEFRRLLGRFVDVCNAISYAHSRGVIHRDIKPGNIMLGSFGETLVVDWGLAKVTGAAEAVTGETTPLAVHSLSDTTSAETMMGAAIGTIGYMSPEQAAGRIDLFSSVTDIYLLGATLYHVLTGRPPHTGTDSAKILKKIQQEEVVSPRQFNKAIPAPLAAICLRAMALKPADRYAAAQEIAAELERYLADEPVKAHREPLTVRVRRTLRKHPALTAAFTATLLVGVVGFGVGSILLGNKNLQLAAATKTAQENERAAEKNAREADTRRIESSKLAQFWIGLLQGTDPVGHGAAALIPKTKETSFTVNDMLTEGAKRVQNDSGLEDFPQAKAAILYTMGDVNRQLGRYDVALPLLEQSLAIRERELPADSPDLAASMNAMGCYFQERGEYPKADALFRKVVDIRRQIPTPDGRGDLATTLMNLGAMRGHESEFGEAEKIFREVIQIRESLPVRNEIDIAIAKMGLAFTLAEQQRRTEALALVAECQAAFQTVSTRQNVPSAAISFAIGTISRAALGPEVAEGQLRSALNNMLQAFDKNSVWVAIGHYELAKVLVEQNKFEEAGEQFEASLKICREQIQLRHPRVRMLIDSYTRFLANQNRTAEANRLWDEFLAAQIATFGDDHRVVLAARLDYADYLWLSDQYSRQLAVLQPLRAAVTYDPRVNLQYHLSLGRCLHQNQQFAAAAEVFRAAERIQIPEPHNAIDAVLQFNVHYELAFTTLRLNRPVGTQLMHQLLSEARSLEGNHAKEALKDVLEELVSIADKDRDYVQLIAAGEEYYKLLGGVTGNTSKGFLGGLLPNPFAASQPVTEDNKLTKLRHQLALAHEFRGDYDKALPYWHESVARGEKQFGVDHKNTVTRRAMLKNCEQMITEQQRIAGNLALRKPGQQYPKVTASHTSPYDKVERANDGIIHYAPAAFQRWTSFDSQNSSDWLEVEFAAPTKFSKIELAIYDEEQGGGVQAPAEYYAEIWDGAAWTRIADQAANPEKPVGNRWNSLEFAAVTAQRLRIVFVHAQGAAPNSVQSGLTEIAIWP